MDKKEKHIPEGKMLLLILSLMNAIVISRGYTQSEKWYTGLIVTCPLLILAILNFHRDRMQKVLKKIIHN